MPSLAVSTSSLPSLNSAEAWFERLTVRANRYAASRLLVWLAFTILYLIPSLLISRYKLFWDDEFFTLYLARTADWRTLLQALGTGADQHPPSFYYLTHCIIGLFGTGHVTLRLTAIVGFWILCICLYEILKSLTNPMWAVVGMLVPLTTPFYYYATEARAYGLVIGFTSIALLSWLRASANRRRTLFLALLASSLAFAVASHYYAGIALGCLMLGEAVRTKSQRKIDWPIWIAFAFSFLPILVFHRTIQSAAGYSHHFWAIPAWSEVIDFYPAELGSGPVALLGALGVVLCFRISLGARKSPASSVERQPPLKLFQTAAICSLSALPLIVMFIAKFVTHGFTNRYASSAMVGITILLCYILYRVMPLPRAALVASGVCVAMFGFQVYRLAVINKETRRYMAANIHLLSETGNQQIIVLGITVFHQTSFYAPRELVNRLTYLADPEASVRYIGHDTVDRGLLDLDPWFPLNVVPARFFLENNPQFLAFGTTNSWTWVTFDLPKWGDTRLLGRHDLDCLMFSVTNVHPLPGGGSKIPAYWKQPDMLYSKMPKSGQSLCDLYMGAKSCPSIYPVVDAVSAKLK